MLMLIFACINSKFCSYDRMSNIIPTRILLHTNVIMAGCTFFMFYVCPVGFGLLAEHILCCLVGVWMALEARVLHISILSSFLPGIVQCRE